MIGLSVIFEEPAWPELADKAVVHIPDADISVAVLDHGMSSGRPSVAIKVTLPDGQEVIAETTARLFCGAGRAIHSRYPNLFND